MVIKTYSRLNEALENLQQGQRVWAVDKRRQDREGGTYIGKMFLLGTTREIFNSMWQRVDPSTVYEIIDGNGPAKLYLDIEFARPSDTAEFSPQQLMLMTVLVRKVIRKFIKEKVPTLTDAEAIDDTILEACSVDKFSLHYIHNKLVFNNTRVSMACFVFELRKFFTGMIYKWFQHSFIIFCR